MSVAAAPPLAFWAEPIEDPVVAAHRNVEAWHQRFGGMFTGWVKVGRSEATAETRAVGAEIQEQESAK